MKRSSYEASVQKYFSTMVKYEQLTKAEETELLKAAKTDLKARNALVLHNWRFVVVIADMYTGYGVSLADLIMEGNVGMLKAAESYDTKKGYTNKFTSYAVWWIRQHILQAIGDHGNNICKVPLYHACKAKKVKDGSLTNQFEVSKIHVITEKALSIHAHIGRENGKREIKDVLIDSSWDPEEGIKKSDMKNSLLSLLSILDSTDKHAVEIIFGLNTRVVRTLKETGSVMNISSERVRQIKDRAIKKLRHPANRIKLNTFAASVISC